MTVLNVVAHAAGNWSDDSAECARVAVGGISPALVARPTTAEAVARTLGVASEAGLAVIPVGGGTRLQTGNPPRRYDVALSLNDLYRVVAYEPDDLTITVEAGLPVAGIAERVWPRRQRLTIDPPHPDVATVGGVLASASTGPRRLRHGPARDAFLGMQLARADGTLARTGGRVVKNVAGYDLSRLLVGSYGTLAVITEATLRLVGIQTDAMVVWEGSTVDDVARWLALAGQLADAAWIQRTDGWRGVALVGGPDEAVTAAVRALPGDRVLETPEPTDLPIRFTVPPVMMDLGWIAPWPAATFDASGVGGLPADLGRDELIAFREKVEARGGSLVIQQGCAAWEGIDAWGTPPASIGLMRRIKDRLDPSDTLSPGRFVGGI